ncbi:MAG: Cytochrome c biogenesis ATP-binding export protein CcmA [Alphaproteobacteria bacterium MarineAlpha3_Bin5]|nr:heme ABC transporter ATP-binding protein CcmA [Magnetovibrio sp.]PPR76822.1 MAG: Cytochrome c biogenesis ATP-binding export protein CcmA [Alphaproteobacteria bacterium MarineAlpha3_Bin5]
MALFEARNLKCCRGDRTVFRGLSFCLEEGQALVLKGRNGSGKSSLIRILAGLLSPVSGDVIWEGETVFNEPEEHFQRFQYIGHLNAIKPTLTISENITYWVKLHGGKLAYLTKALKKFDLENVLDLPVRFLSAGQKRRVGLVRLIVSSSVIWLLDEPATSLDNAMIEQLENIIRDHRKEGGIVILSTHQNLKLDDAIELQLDSF